MNGEGNERVESYDKARHDDVTIGDGSCDEDDVPMNGAYSGLMPGAIEPIDTGESPA